ncbi:MAG: PDZ domain-containing protein [Candidatus Omnitrophica bacterium]|nr:PDZ domain-containing protein [Candidatus Omnitrophota bacterium]
MKRDILAFTGAVFVLVLVVLALFNNKPAFVGSTRQMAKEIGHEIRTADMFKLTAFCPTTPSANYTPVALTQKTIIKQGAEKPVLIKELGVEAVPISGGKVKITGIMGNSWAMKAGLKTEDIVLNFNGKKLTSLSQFQALLSGVPPEANYKIKVLRGSEVVKKVVWVGEGEMEGFTPIVQVALTRPIQNQQGFGLCFFKCKACGNSFMSQNNGTIYGPNCPICGNQMLKV